jgi:thiamine-monophosphate kinase
MKLGELGEDRLLAQLLPKLRGHRDVILGAGDDCAIVNPGTRGTQHLLKTDCLVEQIHFTSRARPEAVGWKALARPLSDFAAMSGVPQFALITLILPSRKTLAWVKQLYRGIDKAARAFGVIVVGGETSRTNGPAVISITVTGFVEKRRWVSRAGGKPGDDLFVTGRLGGSLRGGHLSFIPRLAESRWLTANFRIHAMMDLSDGLGADLPRLARASKVGFEIDRDALPLNPGCTITQAISDGEDYELLFAIAPKDSRSLPSRWRRKFATLPLTRIGRLNRKSQIANRKSESNWFHRAGRCGKDDIDRRARPAVSESKSKGPNRDFVARPQRSRQRRVAGRPRDDDQFAG